MVVSGDTTYNAPAPQLFPKTEQLREQLWTRRRILRGELADGSQLPAERDLAAAYGVSGATVREAIRVLSSTGLVDVRHGSGSYVHARADTLIATLLASVVEVQQANLVEFLDVAQALNARAGQLAAVRATPEELASLRDAAANVPDATVEEVMGGLKWFFSTLWAVAHSRLLTALGRFLMEIQLGIALELSASRLDLWQAAARDLAKKRIALVDAVEARNPERAAALVIAYHAPNEWRSCSPEPTGCWRRSRRHQSGSTVRRRAGSRSTGTWPR